MANHQASKRRRQENKRKKELLRKAKHKRQAHKPLKDPEVGYVARHGMEVLCDEERFCVVMGRRAGMKSFIKSHGSKASDYAIEPATASHILTAMSAGGKYAFDQESYQRLIKPAQAFGLSLKPVEFSDAGSEGIYLVRLDPDNFANP